MATPSSTKPDPGDILLVIRKSHFPLIHSAALEKRTTDVLALQMIS